jgi:hypothetical protein
MMFAFRIAVAALATATVSHHGAAAQDHWFTTSGGVRIATPPVADLDCAGLRSVLNAIDRSGYRGATATPVDSADAQLLHYEDRVSRRFYIDCVNAPGAMADGGGAFGYGYDDEEGARQ